MHQLKNLGIRGLTIFVAFGFISLTLFGCSAKVYQISNVSSLTKEELAALVLPAFTNIRIFSVDNVEGPNKAGYPFTNRRGYEPVSGGAFRIEMIPGIHILEIGFIEHIPGMTKAIMYSPQKRTLVFDAEKGRTYTITAKVNGFRWEAYVIEKK